MNCVRSDAVGAFFVFLHLLKGNAELLAKFHLAHAQLLPAHAYFATDIDIGVVGPLGRYCRLFCHHTSDIHSQPNSGFDPPDRVDFTLVDFGLISMMVSCASEVNYIGHVYLLDSTKFCRTKFPNVRSENIIQSTACDFYKYKNAAAQSCPSLQ